jgi:hypothetical protein
MIRTAPSVIQNLGTPIHVITCDTNAVILLRNHYNFANHDRPTGRESGKEAMYCSRFRDRLFSDICVFGPFQPSRQLSRPKSGETKAMSRQIPLPCCMQQAFESYSSQIANKPNGATKAGAAVI